MTISLILYVLLGVALSASGVGIMDKPWQFLCILGLVVCIDLNSNFS